MPNKRPYHTIIPSMLTYAQDNTLLGVMGAMVSSTTRGSLLRYCISSLHVLAMVVVHRSGCSTFASMTAHILPLLNCK
jgi:gamma-glutamyltranspeptidase